MDRNLQILGLAKKAGLLAVGAQDTYAAARSGKASVVISASDASDSAMRRAGNSAEEGCAVHISVPYTAFELGNVSGRGSPSTVAILDAGLGARFLKGLAEAQPDTYLEAAELLGNEAREQAERRRTNPSAKRRTVQ